MWAYAKCDVLTSQSVRGVTTKRCRKLAKRSEWVSTIMPEDNNHKRFYVFFTTPVLFVSIVIKAINKSRHTSHKQLSDYEPLCLLNNSSHKNTSTIPRGYILIKQQSHNKFECGCCTILIDFKC